MGALDTVPPITPIPMAGTQTLPNVIINKTVPTAEHQVVMVSMPGTHVQRPTIHYLPHPVMR